MRDMAEQEEVEAVRLSTTRTPQRDPARGPRPIDRHLLNRRAREGEPEETSLLVKKFLLKKKDSKSLRRLVTASG